MDDAHLVLLPIMVRQFASFGAEVLLHERVYDDFFANCVARNLPGQLTRPPRLGVGVSRRLFVVVVVFVHLGKSVVRRESVAATHLLVVLLDRIRESLFACHRSCKI